ncbi:TPA: hypothetical protein ACPJ2G_004738 [Vibrio alginolyticus]|nr:hypothetical protein [Vibrio alginolyticus]
MKNFIKKLKMVIVIWLLSSFFCAISLSLGFYWDIALFISVLAFAGLYQWSVEENLIGALKKIMHSIQKM